jgi:hypothetical protein
MSLGSIALLGLVLSAPAPARPPAPAPVVCTKYRVMAEENELVDEDDVAAWATGALEKAALLDAKSPCFLHVRITAGPISSGGRKDGWIAHVALSTRRFLKDGKLVTNEKGMLLVDPEKDGVVARARGFVEEFVARLPAVAGAREGGRQPSGTHPSR